MSLPGAKNRASADAFGGNCARPAGEQFGRIRTLLRLIWVGTEELPWGCGWLPFPATSLHYTQAALEGIDVNSTTLASTTLAFSV